jgi:uncharacterized protein (DUF58 family)
MGDRIFDTEFLKRLNTIAINARMAMSEGGSGTRKSKAKGSSVEFSDFREYTPGDDFRRIDWNAYARFDRLFVKLFMEEREAAVNIFVDSSKSMDFGQPKKSIMALKLAAVLSFLTLGNLDRVCINSMKDNNISQSNSMTGRVMFDRCINFLEGINFSGSTNINECIKRKDFKGRGISIILSDFFTPGGIEEAVKYLLYKKQEVVLIHILSEEELNPSLDGQVRLLDSETGQTRDVAVTPVILKQYNKQLNVFMNSIKEYSTRMGASYVMVCNTALVEKVVLEEFSKAGIIG